MKTFARIHQKTKSAL